MTRKVLQNVLTDLPYLFFFVVFSTAGMAAIGVSLLAKPVSEYYSDKAEMTDAEMAMADLKDFYDQQAKLMENLDNPAVLERLAISNLNYLPKGTDPDRQVTLPTLSPEFKNILEQIKLSKTPRKLTRVQVIAESLAGNDTYQILLFGFGGALVIVSLTCFYKHKA
ncbi:MAG: hypothetical protein K9M57_08415 [Phycisphaerae bacterium]|nr:hypothetical protein [Phycisphaerae bacterium]